MVFPLVFKFVNSGGGRELELYRTQARTIFGVSLTESIYTKYSIKTIKLPYFATITQIFIWLESVLIDRFCPCSDHNK